jgi:hypothetical protein
LVGDAVAPNPDRPMAPACRPKGDQIGFLTDDYFCSWPLADMAVRGSEVRFRG